MQTIHCRGYQETAAAKVGEVAQGGYGSDLRETLYVQKQDCLNGGECGKESEPQA